MRSKNLSFDEAPPLGIATPFFFTAPLFVLLAGALVLARHDVILVSPWAPSTVALTHLGTLGFLLMVMMGALYQMAPVVAGSPVPWLRLAHPAHALLAIGAFGFGAAGFFQSGVAFTHGGTLAAFGLLLFVLPLTWALLRTKANTWTVWGMRSAIFSVIVTGLMGFLMSQGYGGRGFPGDRGVWIQFHLSMGLLGWVGALVTAVSFQVVPMFYLSAPIKSAHQSALLLGVAFSTLALPLAIVLLSGWSPTKEAELGAWLALPAAFAVWIGHPWVIGRALRARKRRRPDATLSFWKMGLAAGPFTAVAALVAVNSNEPRWGLLFGWLSIWSWAGAIVHGMLHRIVPFLVWLNWFADRVGKGPVPTTRSLLPDARTRICLWLHLSTSFAGALAIASSYEPLALLTGALLIATGGAMLVSFLLVFRKGKEALRPQAT